MALGRRIGKVAGLSRICDGFLAKWMMAPRMAAAQALVLQGRTPWDIDQVMLDLVGLAHIADRLEADGRNAVALAAGSGSRRQAAAPLSHRRLRPRTRRDIVLNT
ncbi:hypothetical protein FHS96_005174 [Sphingomonas zeicaulis]|uniref:3-hydroxyacyl-CoA dehydrogenase family protein n=1 Tax=Sphingomonas zeicaulis TaxID=1632740 RepID=UPI003D1994A8